MPSLRSKLRSLRPAVLVFRTGQLGDTLVAMPAMQLIRRNFPGHRMVLLTDRHHDSAGFVSSWDVLKGTGWFDDVIFYTPAKGILDMTKNMRHLAGVLRGLEIDRVFALTPERSIWQEMRDRFFFRHLAGIDHYHGSIDPGRPAKRSGSGPGKMEPEWRRLLRIADGGCDAPEFVLDIPRQGIEEADRILGEEGLSPGIRLLAIGPGSKMPAKRWQKDRFVLLCRQILSEFSDMKILVLGGAEDRAAGDDICAQLAGGCLNLAGRLSVFGSAAVLRRCCLYIGNDTGTMHLAAMAGRPCVAFFSARDYPEKWEPYGSGHVVLRHEVDCSGCMLEVCPRDNACLGMITTDEAIGAVRAFLVN